MTDFDKEFELLAQYIKYRIDWRVDYIRSMIRIDLSSFQKMDAESLIRFYRETGVVFYNGSSSDSINRNDTLHSFDEWKEYKLKNTL